VQESRVFGGLGSILFPLPSNRVPDVQDDPTDVHLGAPRRESYSATTWVSGFVGGLVEGRLVGGAVVGLAVVGGVVGSLVGGGVGIFVGGTVVGLAVGGGGVGLFVG
jgi:hypothetical protein